MKLPDFSASYLLPPRGGGWGRILVHYRLPCEEQYSPTPTIQPHNHTQHQKQKNQCTHAYSVVLGIGVDRPPHKGGDYGAVAPTCSTVEAGLSVFILYQGGGLKKGKECNQSAQGHIQKKKKSGRSCLIIEFCFWCCCNQPSNYFLPTVSEAMLISQYPNSVWHRRSLSPFNAEWMGKKTMWKWMYRYRYPKFRTKDEFNKLSLPNAYIWSIVYIPCSLCFDVCLRFGLLYISSLIG